VPHFFGALNFEGFEASKKGPKRAQKALNFEGFEALKFTINGPNPHRKSKVFVRVTNFFLRQRISLIYSLPAS
jgi:hypothetical protein